MDKDLVDRLFDPTFNSCRSDEEAKLAWAVQARLADTLRAGGKHRGPPPKDRHAIIRRQASERDADLRLREQHDRVDPDLHVFECDDDPAYAAVIAEVPEGTRVDGWTANRRTLFLEKLEEHGSILAAARASGMSRRSVYRLLPRAPAFAAAFEAAMGRVAATLADTLFDRALHGHEVPVMHAGDVVATRTVHHDMLGLYLLRMRDPLNYAPVAEGERWLAGRGLTPLRQRTEVTALLSADGVLKDPAPAPPPGLRRPAGGNEDSLVRSAAGNERASTGDLRDLVQEAPPSRMEIP